MIAAVKTMICQWQDGEVRDIPADMMHHEVVTLMMAGHETTALALIWTWMLLAQHPDVEEKLCQDIQSVLQGRSPTADDVAQFKYATWVIKELMRLYPPAWGTSRQVVETLQLGDYTLTLRPEYGMNMRLQERRKGTKSPIRQK